MKSQTTVTKEIMNSFEYSEKFRNLHKRFVEKLW